MSLLQQGRRGPVSAVPVAGFDRRQPQPGGAAKFLAPGGERRLLDGPLQRDRLLVRAAAGAARGSSDVPAGADGDRVPGLPGVSVAAAGRVVRAEHNQEVQA